MAVVFLKAVERQQANGTGAQGTGRKEDESGAVAMAANPESLLWEDRTKSSLSKVLSS